MQVSKFEEERDKVFAEIRQKEIRLNEWQANLAMKEGLLLYIL